LRKQHAIIERVSPNGTATPFQPLNESNDSKQEK
jgi:hypothetical protein